MNILVNIKFFVSFFILNFNEFILMNIVVEGFGVIVVVLNFIGYC